MNKYGATLLSIELVPYLKKKKKKKMENKTKKLRNEMLKYANTIYRPL